MDNGKHILRQSYLVLTALTCLLANGCGQSNEPGPEVVMGQFLQALRDERHDDAAALLTPLARSKTAEMQMVLSPSSSESASFKVLEHEIEGDEAQVGSDWTDLDEDGQKQTNRIVWLMRRGPEGWRVAGMATRVFDDQEPLVFNFEDPAEMVRRQQAAAAEMARRQEAGEASPEGTPPSVTR